MPKLVYWDACSFITLINREPGKSTPKFEPCAALWEEAKSGKVEIATSFLTFAEVVKAKCEGQTKPFPESGDKEIQELLSQKFIKAAVVDARIALNARQLIRQYKECHKPADGIHVATALAMDVDEMHTTERGLQDLTGRLLKVNGSPLVICFPRATATVAPASLFPGS